MRTCYVSRFGGFGDVLHASHLPRILKEHYKLNQLDWETNYQGYQILQNNPFIDNLYFVDTKKMTQNRLIKNWDYAKERYDLFFNLINTIEVEYCCNEDDSRYYRSTKWRREHLNRSYYDVMVDACNLPETYYGRKGELFYEAQDHAKAKEWIAKKKDTYDRIILVNLSGSSLHKRFVQARPVVLKILEAHPKTCCVLTGGEDEKRDVFEHERVISWVGKKNFRTAALMSCYMDLTVSVESGLPLVAHAWGAPCLQLLTAASPENHCIGAKNAHWLQSPIYCSPCHKNPHRYWGCPTKDELPACVFFNEDEIVKKIEEILYEAPHHPADQPQEVPCQNR